MIERLISRWYQWLRWGALAVAAIILLIFLLAQRQSIDVSYGRSPAATTGVPEGSAGELAEASVPSVEEMAALVAADPVVRLPGAIAEWDEDRVQEAIGDSDVRILVAPPGLDEEERDRVRDVEGATIRVVGTEVSGGFYGVSSTTLPEWQARFATGDVTEMLTALIAALREEPDPEQSGLEDSDLEDADGPLARRGPDEAELTEVVADLRETGVHVAEGATLTDVPQEAAASAFPDGALYVALPRQPFGEPMVRYGPALAELFPDTSIVVMYGYWIEYHGPGAENFAEVVATSVYSRFQERIGTYAYPQDNILFVYLNRVTDVRYAGLFERPLPYLPFDPLRVALPALPWLFAACVLAFLALSTRSLLRPPSVESAGGGRVRHTAPPGRLAGLTSLAVEMSALTDETSDPGLTRAISGLQAARSALWRNLPAAHVHELLDEAEAELDATASAMGRADYRPHLRLQGRQA
ncbi:hypothetical protein FHR81_004460 [Actinoalloteichus hoggarensis]|uniref:Uncharacterized protein n=1 Tax=Actinoalloteichus hoggarensis TaxID=1470176 RepID=A0A221W3Y7_9PSEU|nr:hypothetical protein [Actinoalloteichus hoggarensis]ASO20351.1 hypothetical protein AHOG_13540 [Actinoalloteichus hoggarensis]MBB5923389.1 hypothetical protein [Actinoalloteichus hoggarensis]